MLFVKCNNNGSIVSQHKKNVPSKNKKTYYDDDGTIAASVYT